MASKVRSDLKFLGLWVSILTIFSWFWPFLHDFDHFSRFWPFFTILTIFVWFWQLFKDFEHFYPILTTCSRFWSFFLKILQLILSSLTYGKKLVSSSRWKLIPLIRCLDIFDLLVIKMDKMNGKLPSNTSCNQKLPNQPVASVLQ